MFNNKKNCLSWILSRQTKILTVIYRIPSRLYNLLMGFRLSIKRNIGLPEILVTTRHLLLWGHSLWFSPFLLRHFNDQWALVLMFISCVLIGYFFLIISDWAKKDWFQIEGVKNGEEIKSKTFLVRILLLFERRKSTSRTYLFLFLTDALLLALYSRHGHHKYNGLPDYKTWFMFLASSLFATLSWIVVIFAFNAFGIPICIIMGIVFILILRGIYVF